MLFIYRIENKKGEGCYYGKHLDEKINKIIGSHFCRLNQRKEKALHPLPEEDIGIKRYLVEEKYVDLKQKNKRLNGLLKKN